ncbi:hypothetical protein FOZ60_009758 [Perkinsus olseni]|uniref:Calcium permeable stress-gated cation channel 1 n=1 Tax=Perkinsus olseni TaxID=32597 RepID=A0A7J6NGZ9_PEROL|nr:hypothetical protein FOZ60_009758 [Perkinsus olseni]
MADSSSDGSSKTTTSMAVLISFGIYVGIFAIMVLVYCLVKSKAPALYNCRDNIPELSCPLSDRKTGKWSWIRNAVLISDDELVAYAGLDAAAFIRMLRMGIKISCVGCLNSIYLIPIYKYQDREKSPGESDPMQSWSLGNLLNGDTAMIATLMASYLFYGYSMYLIYHEFSWYLSRRHQYLARMRLDNYTVFVRGLPQDMRSNRALRNFFEDVAPGQVLDARVALDIDELEKQEAARSKIIPKLEHAYNVAEYEGERPEMKVKMCGKEKMDTITVLERRLAALNRYCERTVRSAEDFQEKADELFQERFDKEVEVEDGLAGQLKSLTKAPVNIVKDVADIVPLPKALNPTNLLPFGDKPEFKVRADGFVTFRSLKASMSALQMLHSGTPFKICAMPAPLPDDVFWDNVGMPHMRQELGMLLSIVLTVVLCVFWTVPVAFVSSVSQVQNLKKELPFLEDWSEAWPGVDVLLQQISPILLAILNSLLVVFLKLFSQLEGHISNSTLNASLFAKLAAFYIIQTFFVSAIAGSLLASLHELSVDPWGTIQDILGNNLPQQSNYFMSFVFVQVGPPLGAELLRYTPYVKALIREKLGPKLTEKERSQPFFGLQPLTNPVTLDQPALLSTVMLFFMILFVYAVTSPIVAFVMAFAFACEALIYKNQYAFIYDPSNDSGGQMWTRAMRFIIFCEIVAEITVMAVLAIKEGAVASPLMVPLFIGTILFWLYLEQQHFRVAVYLPSRTCVEIDMERSKITQFDFNQWSGEYRQQALKVPYVRPDIPPNQHPPEELIEAGLGRLPSPSLSSSSPPSDDFITPRSVFSSTAPPNSPEARPSSSEIPPEPSIEDLHNRDGSPSS